MSAAAHDEPRWSAFATDDWDEAQRFGSASYFPHSISPTGRSDGAIDFSMQTVEFSGVTLGRTRYGAAIRMECGYLDQYHLLIPTRGSVRNVSGTQSFVATPEGGAIYNHSQKATVWRSRASDHLALKLDRAVVEREVSLILGRRITEPVVFDMAIDLRSPGSRRWFAGLSVLQHGLGDHRVLDAQSLLLAELRSFLVLGLLVGQRHNYSSEIADDRRSPSTPSVSRRAARLIDDAPQRPWTIGALAAESGSSVRALQEGFRRTLGLSPLQYLAQVRLEHAHRALRDADAETSTVTGIAHAWGFSHLGRFAGSHLERFGEHPSETLRSTRRS